MPRSTLLQLLWGACYPWRALLFLGRHRLWPLALWAVAVNVALFAAACYLALHWVLPAIDHLVAWTLAAAPAALGGRPLVVGPFAQTLVGWTVWALCLPLLLFACAAGVLLVGQVVASPVLDRLSERCEALVLGTEAPPWRLRQGLDAALLSAADLSWGLWMRLWTLGPRLLVGLVPGLGGLMLWGLAASFLAHEFVGLPLTRHLVPARTRYKVVMSQPGLSLGFGGATYALMLLPGLNLVLLPLACVGGTLLYCDLVRHQLVDPGALRTAG